MRTPKQLYLLSYLRFIIPATVGLLLTSCENDIEKIKLLSDNQKFPVERGENIEMTYTDSGRVRVKMFSPLIERYDDERPHTEMTKGLTCYFYNANGQIDNIMKAKYAIRYDQEKKMEARDSVLLQNVKGEKLNTEQIFWDEMHHKISSPKFVTIRTADEILYGDGFESNEDFTNYKIFHLRGQVKLKDANAANP